MVSENARLRTAITLGSEEKGSTMRVSDIEAIGRALSPRTYLATVGHSGEPHVVPVHPGWEGSTIWIMTGATAVKTRNISQHPRVSMHWETNDVGDGLLVWGNAAIHSDEATKARLWNGVFDYDLTEFAPGGSTSPDIVFLAIEPVRAVHALAYGAGGGQRWAPD